MKRMKFYAALLCIASLVLMMMAPAFTVKAEQSGEEIVIQQETEENGEELIESSNEGEAQEGEVQEEGTLEEEIQEEVLKGEAPEEEILEEEELVVLPEIMDLIPAEELGTLSLDPSLAIYKLIDTFKDEADEVSRQKTFDDMVAAELEANGELGANNIKSYFGLRKRVIELFTGKIAPENQTLAEKILALDITLADIIDEAAFDTNEEILIADIEKLTGETDVATILSSIKSAKKTLDLEYLATTFYDYNAHDYLTKVNKENAVKTASEAELIFSDGSVGFGGLTLPKGKLYPNCWIGRGSIPADNFIVNGIASNFAFYNMIGSDKIYSRVGFSNTANDRLYSKEYYIGVKSLPFIKETLVSTSGSGETVTQFNYIFDSKLMNVQFVNADAAGNMIPTFAPDGKSEFYPLNHIAQGKLVGGQNKNNIHFGMIFQTKVKLGSNSVFTFAGDDDVWVYVDEDLALDIGGIHDGLEKSCNLSNFMDGKYVDDQEHVLTLCFFERGSYKSDCRIEFSSFKSVRDYVNELTDYQVNYYYEDADGNYTEDTALEENGYGVLVGSNIPTSIDANEKPGYSYEETKRGAATTTDRTETFVTESDSSKNVIDIYYGYTPDEPTPTPEEPTPTPEEPTPTPEEPTPTPEEPTPTPEEPTPTPEEPTPTPEEPTPTPEEPTPTPEEPTPTPEAPTPTPTTPPLIVLPTPTPEAPTATPTPTPEPEIEIEEPEVPEGTDEPEDIEVPEDDDTVEEPEEIIDVEEEEIPEGGDVLPKTGTLPVELFYGLGGIMQVAGITLFVKSGKKKKEEAQDEE